MRFGRLESDAVQEVSSAKRNDRRSVDRGRSLIKQRKRIGPRMVPCSTDIASFCESERLPFISTCWVLSDK